MKTKICLPVRALVVLVCAVSGFASAAPQTPATGKVLVLHNERTLEGDVELTADVYRVRRQTGEATVPASQVLRLCASLEDAFVYVQSRANLSDPDERLRLAQWAHVRGLRTQALEEVQAASKLRPNHSATMRLLTHLKQQAETVRDPQQPQVVEAEEPIAPVEVTNESLCSFSTKVQPVLMNACANCHASGKGGSFILSRAYFDSPPTSRAVQKNLTAVLSQLNLQQPQGSPLLTKAVSAHGPLAQAPLKGRQAAAFKLLEDWVNQTVTTNPHLRTQAGLPPLTPADLKPVSELGPVKDEKSPPTSFGEMKPPEPTVPLDPFDPSIFNRQMHPKR